MFRCKHRNIDLASSVANEASRNRGPHVVSEQAEPYCRIERLHNVASGDEVLSPIHVDGKGCSHRVAAANSKRTMNKIGSDHGAWLLSAPVTLDLRIGRGLLYAYRRERWWSASGRRRAFPDSHVFAPRNSVPFERRAMAGESSPRNRRLIIGVTRRCRGRKSSS